jgi:hypothetical protein
MHPSQRRSRPGFRRGGFTLLEIAVCLGVIGFAIVAVLGVLPTGLNVQRDTRERTVILQDAKYFVETIRRGAVGTNDLSQYVAGLWDVRQLGGAFSVSGVPYATDADIIHALCMPRDTEPDTNHLYTVALVRSLTGPASEKGPNTVGDRIAFQYLLKAEVAPSRSIPPEAMLTTERLDVREDASRGQQLGHLQGNLYELRVTVLWPATPADYSPQFKPENSFRNQISFRTFVGGELNVVTNLAGVREWTFKPRRFL